MALSSDQRSLIVSNLVNGVDTYTVPPRNPIRSFGHPIRDNKILQVSSALHGALTIAGSDDGCVRLFEQRTGPLYSQLPHGNGESRVMLAVISLIVITVGTFVQAITVRTIISERHRVSIILQSHSNDRRCLIISGSSDINSPADIKVWSVSMKPFLRL